MFPFFKNKQLKGFSNPEGACFPPFQNEMRNGIQ
jgi:hypothetical protein